MSSNNWISVNDRLPEYGKRVLALIKTNAGHWTTTAIHYPKFFKRDESDYEGDCDYSEEKDEYYWPEGWYEYQFEPDLNFHISQPVTHWQPLPEPPQTENK